MKINKVNMGSQFNSNGIPKLFIHHTAKINIGNYFSMNNTILSNPIGRNHRCLFAIRDCSKLTIGNHVGMSGTTLVCTKEIEIGDYVYIRQTKKNAKYITEGTVFKLTNTYVYYEKNGEKLGIRYCNIEKIKKGKDNSNNKLINNNKKLTNEEIIAKLKIGQKVKFRLKTKIEEGTIVSINKSRASIVLQDGKKWYIPYNLFILE